VASSEAGRSAAADGRTCSAGAGRADGCSFTPQRILSGRDEADGAFRDREEADSDDEESSEEDESSDDDADPDNAALPESPYQANAAPRKSSPPPSSAQPAASALAGSSSSKPARAKGGVSFGNSTSAPAAEALAGSDDDDADLRSSGPSNRDAGKAVKLKNLSVSQPMSRRERCVGSRASRLAFSRAELLLRFALHASLCLSHRATPGRACWHSSALEPVSTQSI